MIKILLSLAAATVFTVVFTGCSTVRTSQNFGNLGATVAPKTQTVAHVNSQIYGVYLFNAFPIFSGSPNDTGKTAMFRDTVTVDNGVYLMSKTAINAGANRVVDVQSHYSSTWCPISLLLWIREVQISGTAIK